MFFSVFIIAVLLGSALGYFYVGEGMNLWYMSLCSIAMGGVSCFFAARMHRKHQRWGYLSGSALFVLGFWIVHFFYAALLVFYEDIQHQPGLWPFPDIGNYSILVATIAFSLFFLGYLSLAEKRPQKKVTKVLIPSRESLSRLLFVAPVISVINFGLFIFIVGPTYLSGAYAGSGNWGAGATYFFLFFELFFYLTLILEVYKIRLMGGQSGVLQYALSFNWLTLLFLGCFIIFNVYIGDRGPVITATCILVGGYDVFIKRFKLITVLAVLLFGVVTMSYISNYRTRDAGASLQERIEDAKYKLEEKKWYHAPGELGTNVRTLNAGIAFSQSDGHWYGKFQGVHILGVIPFAKGVVAYTLKIPFGWTSSSYMTVMINGKRGVGVGTTPVADVYLDFGLWGIVILFPLLGRLFAWVECRAFFSQGVYSFVIYMWLLSEALYWPRAVFLHNMNEVVWVLGLLWLANKFFLRGRYTNESTLVRPFI